MLRLPHFLHNRLKDVGEIVKALCYNPKRPRSRPDEVNDIFSIFQILPAALGPRVYSASNRNEYLKQKNYISGE
jgi:hypothetical protein